MKTHRCKELLKSNKDYENGDVIRIHYGDKWLKTYNERHNIGWWLSYLEWDMDYDVKFMTPILKIKYCPFCGERLVGKEDDK